MTLSLVDDDDDDDDVIHADTATATAADFEGFVGAP